MQTLTTTVARYVFIIPFAVFGINHFVNGQQMSAMVPIPGGIFWVYLVGVAHLLAAISFIIKKQAKLAALLLALLLLIFVLTIHLPGLFNAETMQSSMINLLKDLALAGGALSFAHMFDSEGGRNQ